MADFPFIDFGPYTWAVLDKDYIVKWNGKLVALNELQANIAAFGQAVELERDAAVNAAQSASEDAQQTGLDRVATGEDRQQTGLDRAATGQDAQQTGLDRTHIDQQKGLVDAAAQSASEDAQQTGLDRVATGEDRQQTGLDRAATGQDAQQTGLDRTHIDQQKGLVDTAAQSASENAQQTGLDRVATGEDRQQTGLDRAATAEDRAATHAYAEAVTNAVATLPDGSINDAVIASDSAWSSYEVNRRLGDIGAVLDEINGEVA
ncbi:hypothetical protein LOS15_07395 [Halomonas sp. 7T]|uniref:hypothetical protein n=1 Tax=Halomonas sp. 7T TaxID=2893469 RepID=UPI0021D95482|nr:hypothetical protein [Halomonas sp. 7T]UXZ55835.1 hypothetical protein LOS15_07395 [Halomonas sp. 7T]